jgi:hypothetical protein
LLHVQPADATTSQWASVAVLYSAVHLMEVYFDRFTIEHTGHYTRAQDMANPKYGVPRTIDNAYKQLEREARGARYLFVKRNSRFVQSLITSNLAPIVSFVGVPI